MNIKKSSFGNIFSESTNLIDHLAAIKKISVGGRFSNIFYVKKLAISTILKICQLSASE